MSEFIVDKNLGEFGDDFMEKIQEMVPDFLNQIEKTWENIGLPHDERSRRTELLVLAAETMLKKAVRKYDEEYNTLVADIEIVGKQVLNLANELKIKSKEPDEHLSALQLKEFLLSYHEELKAQKQNRMDSYESLKVEKEKLESILGFSPKASSREAVPTDNELSGLRAHVFEMRKEKCELANADETFSLTAECLDSMKSLKDTLEADLQARKDEAEQMRDRIIILWDLLHIPLQEKELFLANNMGHSSCMLQSLKQELEKLELKKVENLQMLILRLREEILMFWDKCLYGKSQKESFRPYFIETYTEEVLDQHEKYLKNLKDFHAECHVCFEKVIRLNDLFEKLIAFVTKKDFNADRFNNRGGALLKEEKERKKVQMLIPKLVTEIKEAVKNWESEHDSPFSVFGMPFTDYVQGQWETYEREKENERTERQLRKARNMADCATLSSTIGSKRPFAQTGTPLTGRASKISRIFTPMSSTSRLTPMNRVCTRSILRAQNTCSTPLGKPPPSTSKTLPKQKIAPRRLHQRVAPARQRLLTNASNTQPTYNPFVARDLDLTALMPSANASTYSDFQNKLTKKCDLDVYSQSSTMALGSPLLGTPRKLRSRVGLPLLM